MVDLIIGIINGNRINLHEIMCSYAAKNVDKLNYMFKKLYLMPVTYVLCKISVVEYSHRRFNWKIL